MFASGPEHLNLSTFADAATGAGDLRPVFYGLLVLFTMVACAKLLSAAMEQARYAFEQVKLALRTLFYTLVVAVLVAAIVLLAFADFLSQD